MNNCKIANELRKYREKFGAWPVQYHDGFHQKARRLRG